MQNLKKALSTKKKTKPKKRLYSKRLLQYGLLQGWDEYIIYQQAFEQIH